MSKRRVCCPRGKCSWVPQHGGKREKCVICGDVFPCPRPGCGHVDCHEARGEAMPAWLTPDPDPEHPEHQEP